MGVGKKLRKKKNNEKEEVQENVARKVTSDPTPIIVGLIFGLGVLIFAFILIIGVQYGFIAL